MDVLAWLTHGLGLSAAAGDSDSNNINDDPDVTITTTTLILTTALALTLPTLFLTLFKRLAYPTRPKVYPSPLRTLLPRLSPEQQCKLLYPPDYFPGARDVPTPYGFIRCYEFGPATGRRVLLIHGISTSCMTLTHIAHGLVRRGNCRVLLYDLFGRGYSDGVGDVPHDERLYVSQALLALASSDLAWTGTGPDDQGGFHLIGYSLGGALAVHLANALPVDVVKSVTLLAPAGMIREQNFGLAARFIFRSGWVPDGLLEILTRWRLKRPIAESAKKRARNAGGIKSNTKTGESETSMSTKANSLGITAPSIMPGEKMINAAITSEVADSVASDDAEEPPPNPLQQAVLAYVNWQVIHHAGFPTAFMSTLRHAPMFNQHVAWRTLTARRRRCNTPKTVCFIFGIGDEIVSEQDYRADALALLGGEEEVFWPAPVAGAHDFPMVDPEETLDRIWEFWGWNDR